MFGYALIRAITGAASPGRRRKRLGVLPCGWSRRSCATVCLSVPQPLTPPVKFQPLSTAAELQTG